MNPFAQVSESQNGRIILGMEFSKSPRNQVSRLARRASLDTSVIYPILDEAFICTLSWCEKEEPFQLPTGFVRIENDIFIHGSVGSHFLRQVSDGRPLCGTVTLLDDLVLAKSAFHHSMNYRSVVFFSKAEVVDDPVLQDKIMEAFTNKLVPGRWNEIRKPNASEWRKTMVLRLPLLDASAKVRTGPPVDDEEDADFPVNAGLVPLRKGFGDPVWTDPIR